MSLVAAAKTSEEETYRQIAARRDGHLARETKVCQSVDRGAIGAIGATTEPKFQNGIFQRVTLRTASEISAGVVLAFCRQRFDQRQRQI